LDFKPGGLAARRGTQRHNSPPSSSPSKGDLRPEAIGCFTPTQVKIRELLIDPVTSITISGNSPARARKHWSERDREAVCPS